MQKNNKGFFLAETIVMIALITIVMSLVYPNVLKLYENYVNKIKYYDQIEDIYTLQTIYQFLLNNNTINELTTSTTYGCEGKGEDQLIINNEVIENSDKLIQKEKYNNIIENIDLELYLINYTSTPTSKDYDFKRYLRRIKISTYDKSSYRLIGKFKKNGKVSYASIKVNNPNPYRKCNLG